MSHKPQPLPQPQPHPQPYPQHQTTRQPHRRIVIPRSAILLLALPVLTLFATGCGGGNQKSKIWIYHYPDFYTPQLKRIAVLDFGDPSNSRGVGRRISDRVSSLLTNNRTYEVYTRAHLKDILAERDLADAGIIDGEVAMEIGRLKSVQALICGKCNRYETSTRRETRYNSVAIWGRDSKGNRVITGWRQVPYTWTRHDAYVDCNVVVIDTETGRQIAAVGEPTNTWAQGPNPPKGPSQLIVMAEENEAIAITRGIAVTRTRIKLKGKVLKTATALYDNEWDWEKKITPADEKFYIVVKLPAEADRNNFKLTIVPKNSREAVAEQAFVWDKCYGRSGKQFAVKQIIAKHGLGEYEAKLYSGPEPIATYPFKIVESRK